MALFIHEIRVIGPYKRKPAGKLREMQKPLMLIIVGLTAAIISLVVMIMGALKMESATRSRPWLRGRAVLATGAVTLGLFVTGIIVVVVTGTSRGQL
ncbi:hypothetical protein [Lacisediminihabitans profunda]|uniref:Uncharacterized protein n=1 Tax=Lacisediminihabitans profunda TaxID=2594790 RepID=A0A5C8UW73_9MICO|nr:hypothetical protein [Lacisediminihabitans profunda]TXN32296.1 hypothetical protein FVP33_01310 [Lacisediminihabitans profunda]